MKDLVYITYQTFPSNKANTIQTMANLKYLSEHFKCKLIFPLREKNSSNSDDFIRNYYEINETIKINALKHYLPFGRIEIFQKYLFTISHFLWSYFICKNLDDPQDALYFTRSDWVMYFLSKKSKKVIFECHQLSKTRKYVMKKAIKSRYSQIIFLNNKLQEDSGLEEKDIAEKTIVLHNGVDSKIFSFNENLNKKNVIYSGSFKRFGDNRGIEFLLNCFNDLRLKDFNLSIYGGNNHEVKELKQIVKNLGLKNIKIHPHEKQNKLANDMKFSNIGVLLNSNKNEHSYKYTSPLKYFEYLYSGLNIIAVDFPSHKDLPYSQNITFFNENNHDSFINAVLFASEKQFDNTIDMNSITLKHRSYKIKNFYARLEGLEPPTL